MNFFRSLFFQNKYKLLFLLHNLVAGVFVISALVMSINFLGILVIPYQVFVVIMTSIVLFLNIVLIKKKVQGASMFAVGLSLLFNPGRK